MPETDWGFHNVVKSWLYPQGPSLSLWCLDLNSVFQEYWAKAEMGEVRQRASPGPLGGSGDRNSLGNEAWGQVGGTQLEIPCLPHFQRGPAAACVPGQSPASQESHPGFRRGHSRHRPGD